MRERLEQMRQAWQIAHAANPRLPWLVFVPVAVILVAGIVASVLTGLYWIVASAALLAALVGMVVFGRQAQSAQYASIEGRPGAAAAVLDAARGQWFVRPAVAFTKKQDFVHRVVGRPGVILVAEGKSTRFKPLLTKERTRMKRIVGDTPLHVITVGNGPKDTSLDKLQVTLNKLPRELGKRDVPRLARELEALDRDLPMPKGYIPQPGKKMR
ncbi:DUF4191 domain-containing protein [Salsipaludibacter albus]|uniref:DUF4191 domain-containing protein n=1 Tax=Salsipaludibacter albus TaxID=2849650 RepID=UPI001EE4856A|nr:DUF4191 domain-containing protein [Salsipaludibacter albus]MBY5161930.1 DUF4191 domain-containing protein [Salsipaludibacter albus]